MTDTVSLAGHPALADLEALTTDLVQPALSRTPIGMVACGLVVRLADALAVVAKAADAAVQPAGAGGLAEASAPFVPQQGLTICADTVVLQPGETRADLGFLKIFARELHVAAAGEAATIALPDLPEAGFVLVAASGVTGGRVRLAASGSEPAALAPSGLGWAGQLGQGKQLAEVDVADALRSAGDAAESPAMRCLEAAFAVAGCLMDDRDAEWRRLAALMLRWVNHCASAIADPAEHFPDGQQRDMRDLSFQSAQLLQLVNTAACPIIHVPVLTDDFFAAEIKEKLSALEALDAEIAGLRDHLASAATFAAFAEKLAAAQSHEQDSLRLTLEDLRRSLYPTRDECVEANQHLTSQIAAVAKAQKAYADAVEEKQKKDIAMAVVNGGMEVAKIYVSAGTAVAEFAGGGGGKGVAQLMSTAVEAANMIKGMALDATKGGGAGEPHALPEAAKASATIGKSVGQRLLAMSAVASLVWEVLGNDPTVPIDRLDTSRMLAALPDVSGLEMGGMDPAAYWKEFVALAETGLRQALDDDDLKSSANDLLGAVKLLAIYGTSVADRQATMIRLLVRAVTTLAQIQANRKTVAGWRDESGKLSAKQDAAKLVEAGLRRMLLDIKRSLFLSMMRYRAAYAYEWLREAPITISPADSVDSIVGQCRELDTRAVWTALGSGRHAPQDYEHLVLPVSAGDGLLQDGHRLRWGFALDDAVGRQVSTLLAGSRAAYIKEAYFFPISADGPGKQQVSLEVGASGHYAASDDGRRAWRFQAKPHKLNFSYIPTEGLRELFAAAREPDGPTKAQDLVEKLLTSNELNIVSPWRLSDESSSRLLMLPMLFTDWQLELPKDHAAAVGMLVCVFNVRYLNV